LQPSMVAVGPASRYRACRESENHPESGRASAVHVPSGVPLFPGNPDREARRRCSARRARGPRAVVRTSAEFELGPRRSSAQEETFKLPWLRFALGTSMLNAQLFYSNNVWEVKRATE
jgi:hypothetical protein